MSKQHPLGTYEDKYQLLVCSFCLSSCIVMFQKNFSFKFQYKVECGKGIVSGFKHTKIVSFFKDSLYLKWYFLHSVIKKMCTFEEWVVRVGLLVFLFVLRHFCIGGGRYTIFELLLDQNLKLFMFQSIPILHAHTVSPFHIRILLKRTICNL